MAMLCSSVEDANARRALESRPFEEAGSQSDADLTRGEWRGRLHVLKSAHKEHEINMEALKARISIGERGLGSLARQLHEIQLAMKKRADEIKRLLLEADMEQAAKHDCELEINRLRST